METIWPLPSCIQSWHFLITNIVNVLSSRKIIEYFAFSTKSDSDYLHLHFKIPSSSKICNWRSNCRKLFCSIFYLYDLPNVLELIIPLSQLTNKVTNPCRYSRYSIKSELYLSLLTILPTSKLSLTLYLTSLLSSSLLILIQESAEPKIHRVLCSNPSFRTISISFTLMAYKLFHSPWFWIQKTAILLSNHFIVSVHSIPALEEHFSLN